MRRYARTLILIFLLFFGSVAALAVQKIDIGNFQRGGDTILGLSLGLDLQGGSHMVYQTNLIDQSGETIVPSEEQMNGLKKTIERRINASGLGEPIIQVLGEDRLLVQLPGINDLDRARKLIGDTALLEFKHRTSGTYLDIEGLDPEMILSVSIDQLPDKVEDSENPQSQVSDSDIEKETPKVPWIFIEFSDEGSKIFQDTLGRIGAKMLATGAVSPSSMGASIFGIEVNVEGNESLRYTVTPFFIERFEDQPNLFAIPYAQGGQSTTPMTIEQANDFMGEDIKISFQEITSSDEDIGLTGDLLERAFPSQHAQTSEPIVNVQFNDEGTKIFGELTQEIANDPSQAIAIMLDGNELIAPVVLQPILTGSAIISGSFTLNETRDIALLLESGRLPVPIDLVQERTVDSILGADSLEKSVIAGIIGLALVLVFMTMYYRIPGLVAASALFIYASLILAIFKILPVTLTLSGVAAAILSIGMAVDANILIFERMKDELRSGRTLTSAINIGFNRAWPAIRDSNVSTLITCGILYYFSNQLGTTVVQGFAATLAIGVMISMLSAVLISRTFLRVLALTLFGRKANMFVPTKGGSLPHMDQQ